MRMRTADQSNPSITCVKWSTAEVSTAEERAGGWLQWRQMQRRGIPIGQSICPPSFCMLWSQTTCLSLLIHLQPRWLCYTVNLEALHQLSVCWDSLEQMAIPLPWTMQKPEREYVQLEVWARYWVHILTLDYPLRLRSKEDNVLFTQ